MITFISKEMSGECSVCSLKLANDTVVQLSGEELLHPIHRKCLKIWIEANEIKNEMLTPACPICQKRIVRIESKEESLIKEAFVKMRKQQGIILDRESLESHFSLLSMAFLKAQLLEEAIKDGNREVVRALLGLSGRDHEALSLKMLARCLEIAKEKGDKEIILQIQNDYSFRLHFPIGEAARRLNRLNGGTFNAFF